MPLDKSKSKVAFSRNVSAEMHAGKGQKQALAIAYSVARKAGAKYAEGGDVDLPDRPTPLNPPIGTLPIGSRPDVQEAIKNTARGIAEPFWNASKYVGGLLHGDYPFQGGEALGQAGNVLMATAGPKGGKALNPAIDAVAKGISKVVGEDAWKAFVASHKLAAQTGESVPKTGWISKPSDAWVDMSPSEQHQALVEAVGKVSKQSAWESKAPSGYTQGYWNNLTGKEKADILNAAKDKETLALAKLENFANEGASPGSPLPPKPPWSTPRQIEGNPLERAKALGYTSQVFHGGNSPIMGRELEANHGFYSTPNPELADMYAGLNVQDATRRTPYGSHELEDLHGKYSRIPNGAQVTPLLMNTKNFHEVDAKGGVWSSSGGTIMNAAMDYAKKNKMDGVIVRNIYDEPTGSSKYLGEPKDVYIPLKGNVVRSKFADFDPSKIHLNDLLAGIGGISLAAGTTIGAMKNQKRGGPVKRATGGEVPWFVRQEARANSHYGLLKSQVPGRTDKLPINVKGGSYVLPADIVSAMGQGNTQAGGTILSRMFSKGPYGMALPHIGSAARRGTMKMPKASKASPFAKGGASPDVPIVAAGGEYVVHADDVKDIGGGDMDHGHDILDKFVLHVRKKHIHQLKHLKPPVKS